MDQFHGVTNTWFHENHYAATVQGLERKAQRTCPAQSHDRRLRIQIPDDRFQLQLLFGELYETWEPADQHERNLVDTMVLSIWRRTRILGMEAAGISLKMREQAASRIIKPGTVPPNGHTTGYLAVTSLAEENRAFELLHRYETRYARAYERAARSLIAYRKYRQTESDQTPEPTPDPTPDPAPAPAPTQTKNLPHEPKLLTPPRNAREFQKWQRKMAQRGLSLPTTSRPEPKCPR